MKCAVGGWGLVSGTERTVITPNENAADTLDVNPLTLDVCCVDLA